MIAVGDRAPQFTGRLADGGELRLADMLREHHVVLYFFPKDFTPGCTREACAFRDRRSELAALNAEVVGVSYDTAQKHAQFAAAYHLPYPLVSDADAAIAGQYGVARLGGWLPTRRVTFVIGKDGIVRHVIRSELNIDLHIDEALATLRQLQARS